MVDVKDAFIGAKEISQVLGIGMTKAYAIIKAYNKELDDKGYFTIRGKCPRKYFEQKISSNCRYSAFTVCTRGYMVSFLPTTQMRL